MFPAMMSMCPTMNRCTKMHRCHRTIKPTTVSLKRSCLLTLLASCLHATTAFSVVEASQLNATLSSEASHRLWNSTLFETMAPHLAFYKLQNETIRTNDTTAALQAMENLTCLNFTQMPVSVQKCRDPWTICATIDRTESLVFTTSESGQKQMFSSTSSALGIAVSIVASLGLRYELNRSDRDDYLQIRFEMLRGDVIEPKSTPARMFVSQLFMKCLSVDTQNPFDYFSLTLGDIEDFQNDDIPVITTKNPHDMWKLYVRMPTNPKLSIYDRFHLTEKQCSKELAKDGKHCDPHNCRHGFLLQACLCLCLPGYTGPKCDTRLSSPDASASLGFTLPQFPLSLFSSLSWVHSGLELLADPPGTARRFLWSARVEAPPGSRLHLALYPTHLQRHLEDRPADRERVQARLLYTHAGPSLYRVLHLADHLPVVTLAPRISQVTLLLLGHGQQPLSPLLSGSPLVSRHTPDPRLHLSVARSPDAQSVLLSRLVSLAQLPDDRPPMQTEERMTPPPSSSSPVPEADPLRSYLPVVLGVVCGMWFVLLAVAILCYVQSDRRRAAEPSPTPLPPPTPRRLDSDESSPSDSGSSVSPAGGSVTSAATTVAPSSEDGGGSMHVQFAEPPTEGSTVKPTGSHLMPFVDRRASMYSSAHTIT